MKTFLLIAPLLAAVASAHAQGRDTAFAVHKLFQQKRKGGNSTAATGADMVSSAATLKGAAVGALVGTAPAVLGTLQAERYSVEREAEILRLYAEGWPIPADVRRKLRRKHFHRTKEDVLGTAR